MILIGLTAFAKSGKTTVANLLKERGFKEVILAGKLKDVSAKVFNVPRDHFDDQNMKESPFIEPKEITVDNMVEILNAYGLTLFHLKMTAHVHVGVKLMSPRHIAQYVGTEILRALDSDIHIKTAVESLDKDGKYVMSDVRFPNEANYIKKSNGTLIGIRRDSVFPEDITKVHESESHIMNLLSQTDKLILNNSTLNDFEQQVVSTIGEM